MRRLSISATWMLMALVVSCGVDDPEAERIKDIEPGIAALEVDWEDPIDGVPVETVEQAQALLDFEVLEPEGLGEPTALFIDLPDSPAVIAFVFESPRYGPVVVKEYRPDVPAEDWDASLEELVAGNDAPTRSGRADIVTIGDALRALVTTSEDGSVSSLFLHMGDKEISIRGPDLQFDDVVAIANGFA
ncbi:MAG: hypothetical protein H0W94_04675 [Actinobacteria bacterium]|nr:hypothetical protein [Actinomycetota bacterium]